MNNSTGPMADFTSIQAAVDAVKDGDTIIVFSGIYTENIDVNKELTIISQSGNPEDTVVQPLDEDDYIFYVNANNVTISGFQVGGYTWDPWIYPMDSGIYLDGVQHNNINNNDVSGEEHAISLNLSSNNTLSNNSGSITLRYSDNNLLNNNSPTGTITDVSLHYSDSNLLRDNSVTSDEVGIGMDNSNNNILTGNSIHASENCIWLRSSNNNTVSNNTAGPSMDSTIILDHSDNNILTGNNLDGSEICLELDCSNNNTLSNNTVVCLMGPTIELRSSSNNTMSNNSISAFVGIRLYSSSNNNTVSNNYVRSPDGSIIILSSSNNTVSNNTVVCSMGPAIALYSSSNNTMSNNSMSGCEGVKLFYSSNNNTVSNNYVNSSEGSILILSSSNNVIYNNYFNSQISLQNNAYDEGNNIWNITKTAGTNIIGGPFLGGNYWSDYEGIDTDWDGLGDTLLPYNSEGQIASGGDYMPLVTPAGPAPAIQATVDINPGVLNPKSKGNWITAYIELPACYDVRDIDVSTILLMGLHPAESAPVNVGDCDCNGIPDLMIKFDKQNLLPLLDAENMELTVTGKMMDGSMFEGTDTIRVLIKVK
ncbi:TPA: hypothetical protein HA351_05045 [Methanosarcinaceae archaeon]|nr:hypothetical protein [Methanosarcinaceae archaeon]